MKLKLTEPLSVLAFIVVLAIVTVQQLLPSTLEASRVGIPKALQTVATSLVLDPTRPELPKGFRQAVSDASIATNGRYNLRAYFADVDGTACLECGLFQVDADHDHGSDFNLYAWPCEAGKTGDRCYCIDENANEVIWASNQIDDAWLYSASAGPEPCAVLGPDQDLAMKVKRIAVAQDGQDWQTVD